MLPTLLGRWQTRILLFLCIGLPISAVYALWLAGGSPGARPWLRALGQFVYDVRPLQILCLLLIVGILLDLLYIALQHLRWERDWPFVFQLFFSVVEFFIVLILIRYDTLPFLPASWIAPGDYPYLFLHFGLVLFFSFIGLLGFIQIFMIRWRYKGGEWGKL
jgi:hypothetical protein